MDSPFFSFPKSFIDTESITSVLLDDFDGTYYTFRVASDSMSWHVKKRYSDFVALHRHLVDGGVKPPALPGKISRAGRTEKLCAYVENVILQQDGMPDNVKRDLKDFFEMSKDIRLRADRNNSAFQTLFADTQAQQEQEMKQLRQKLRIQTELASEYQQQISDQLEGWMYDQVEVLTGKLASANAENQQLREVNEQLSRKVEDLVAVVDHHQKGSGARSKGSAQSKVGSAQQSSGQEKVHRRSASWMRRKKRPSQGDDPTATAEQSGAETGILVETAAEPEVGRESADEVAAQQLMATQLLMEPHAVSHAQTRPPSAPNPFQ
jgi:hypothetical protein